MHKMQSEIECELARVGREAKDKGTDTAGDGNAESRECQHWLCYECFVILMLTDPHSRCPLCRARCTHHSVTEVAGVIDPAAEDGRHTN